MRLSSSRLRHHWVTPPSSIYDGCRAVRGSSQSDRRDLLSIVGVGDLQSWTMITFCVYVGLPFASSSGVPYP